MYFWNIKQLKQELIENTLSQTAVFGYVFLYVVLTELMLEFSMLMPAEDTNLYDRLLSLINIMILIGGMIIVFQYNGGRAGRDFATRYFSIGLVVVIRLLVFSLPLLIILAVFVWWDTGDAPLPTTLIDIVIISAWSVVYYFLFARHMAEVAQKSATIPPGGTQD